MTRFLNWVNVMDIHQYQIQHFGGELGLRDKGLLESAIKTVQITFGGDYLHKDIYSQAAAYLFHICKNHPFVDGNKRAGAMSAVVFLELNGYHFNATNEQFTELVMNVASGKLLKDPIADFFRAHVTHN